MPRSSNSVSHAAFLLLGLVALVILQGCSTITANSISDGEDKRLMLKGHDPVAYFTVGKHVPGDPGIKTEHENLTYRFSSEENKQMFMNNPQRFVPQYGGFCTNGIVYAIPWGGDPDTWQIIDDRLYIFGGEGSKRYFLMDEKRNLELAERYWADEVSGKNPVWQRYKRLVFRVPHYKTGKELEVEWQSRKTKG